MTLKFITIPKNTKTRRVEKYPDTPVFTMYAAPVAKGKTFRFHLNDTAMMFLEYPEYVSIATKEGNVYIGNTSNSGDVERFKMTKSQEFSSKALNAYLCKTFDLDNSVDTEFILNLESGSQFARLSIFGERETITDSDPDRNEEVNQEEWEAQYYDNTQEVI